MVRCPHCGDEVPAQARYCPHCGGMVAQRPTSSEQHPLPFSPWGAPPMAMQTAGGGVRAEPVVGPPLTARQVAWTVGLVVLFLLFIVFYVGRGMFGGRAPAQAGNGSNIPVRGIVGELISVGSTAWGVAFTDTTPSMGEREPVHGQFYAVGVVVSNHGEEAITVTQSAVGLWARNGGGHQYQPVMAAWGTPAELREGEYARQYRLEPQQSVAGIIVFDVPPRIAQQRLLVRDLAAASTAFTSAIDLTREKEE